MAKHDSHPIELEEHTAPSAALGAQDPTRARDRDSRTGQRVVTGPEGRMLGPFALPDADGRQIRFRDYRQRRNLVVFFHHGVTCAACRHIVQAFARQVAVFHEQQAAVLAIGPDQADRAQNLAAELGHAFPLLNDPEGRTVARAGFVVPALVVADRWGEIWAAWEGGEGHALPSVDELEEWLTIIQCDCT
jgi:peroxiredoxin